MGLSSEPLLPKPLSQFQQVLSKVFLALCVFVATNLYAQPSEFDAKIAKQFDAFDAFQEVAVDEQFFYAINNTQLTQHDKRDGRVLQRWSVDSNMSGPLTHLDSAVVLAGKLYSTHSNYPGWPMASSVAVWDVDTMGISPLMILV